MPDRDNWTAAMVLKWVLTRDLPTVLAMVDTYGAWIVSEDSVLRAVPEDLDAVMISFCVDPALPPGEKRNRNAVLRSQRVIEAKAEIYRVLRRGDVEARARRNGTGDVEKITSEQWLSLKFQSWNGHDLAVPIDVEQNTLHPRSLADYLTGGVPIDTRPVAWPDPHFMASQVMELWPSETPNQVSERASEQAQTTRNETTADRNQRWYNDFEVRRKSKSFGTNEAIFDAMSRDEFKHNGKAGTIKRAVNSIRGPKGETNRR
jgi:hypothetical protein